jgi:hypothetical protein
MTATDSDFASSASRNADSRTWPTLPAGPSRSSTVEVWIESTMTSVGRSARASSAMAPTSDTDATRIREPPGSPSRPSRSARSLTWAADSSPLA